MSDHDLFATKLASSGLTPADADQLGIELLSPSDPVLRSMLPAESAPAPAIRLQYYTADGSPRPGIYRVRMLGTVVTESGFAQGAEILRSGKSIRYLQPAGTPPAAYFARGVPWPKILADPARMLVITEGELKAACACKHGLACIGLGGVDSWRSKKHGWDLLPELSAARWDKRDVVIIYDSDAAAKPNVARASAQFARYLRSIGALPRIAVLPQIGDGKTGLDDFIVARGIKALTEIIDAAPGDDLAIKLYEMNARYCYVREPDVIYDEADHIQMSPHKAASSALADLVATKIDGYERSGAPKLKEVSLVKEWLRWSSRRVTKRFTFAPGKPEIVDDQYNLWRGWGCEAREGDIKPWLDVLDHIFPAGHEEARQWFVRWLAYPIQHPGAKLATAVLLWSTDQGVGKSLLGFTMRHIYGPHWVMLNQHELEDGYTAWAERRQFVLLDDLSSIGRKEARDNAAVMKTRITQSHITVNVKYVAHYTIPDTINYYLTSNNPDALYLDDQDRRYFVHRVPSGKLPLDVRRRFARWRDGDGPDDGGRGIGPGALLHYLRHEVDLGDFDRWTEPPITDAKADMQRASKSDLAAWVARLKQDPGSVLMFDSVPLVGDLYTTTDLHALCSRQIGAHNLTLQALGIALQGAGFTRRIVAVGKTTRGLYAVRRADHWARANAAELAAHYTKHSPCQ